MGGEGGNARTNLVANIHPSAQCISPCVDVSLVPVLMYGIHVGALERRFQQ